VLAPTLRSFFSKTKSISSRRREGSILRQWRSRGNSAGAPIQIGRPGHLDRS